MKGLKTDLVDPIDPVCPEDERLSAKDLIRDHRPQIDAVRAGIANDPLYDATKHDDLWIVRFVLSHKKKTKPAIAAAKATLEFRKEHNLDAEDIRSFAPHKVMEGRVKEYWDVRCPGNTLIVTIPNPKRGAIAFINMASMVQGTSEKLSYDTWEYAFIYTSEWTFQWLDYITRTTGRFTRSIRLVNLKGITLSTFSRKDLKFDGDVMGKMEDCYPQLLETIYACNAPALIHAIWAVARAIVPKRVLEKFNIINPKQNQKERETLYKHIAEETLPVEHGGLNTVCPHEW